jgi:hypothetical protein
MFVGVIIKGTEMIIQDVIVDRSEPGNIKWKKLDVTPTEFKEDSIGIIENKYGATYLLETEFCDSKGNWSNNPGLLFYQQHPRIDLGHSNYFIIYKSTKTRITLEQQIMITNGQNTIDNLILETIESNRYLIYSHYRHHFHGSPIAIDGGRSYTRLIGDGCYVIPRYNFKIIDGKFEIIS